MKTQCLDLELAEGRPVTTGTDIADRDAQGSLNQILGQTKANVELAQKAAGDDLESLIDSYESGDSSIDNNVEAKLRQKLAELKQKLDTGEKIIDELHVWVNGEIYIKHSPVLSKLLDLETKVINSDGCVTNVLHAACKDWNAAMWLWEHFTSPFKTRDAVGERSNEFLQKHLETHGDNEKALLVLCRKFRKGSRRAAFIDNYIQRLRNKQ